jgi:hypothetical protein
MDEPVKPIETTIEPFIYFAGCYDCTGTIGIYAETGEGYTALSKTLAALLLLLARQFPINNNAL